MLKSKQRRMLNPKKKDAEIQAKKDIKQISQQYF